MLLVDFTALSEVTIILCLSACHCDLSGYCVEVWHKWNSTPLPSGVWCQMPCVGPEL